MRLFQEPDEIDLRHINRKLDFILIYLRVLARAGRITEEREEQMAKTLDDILQEATDTLAQTRKNSDLEDSIIGIVNQNTKTIADLQAQLAAAGTDPVKLQALADTMDALQTAETANGQKVADAILANTGSSTTT